MTRPYRICRRCVMDTSDPEIAFDEEGVCNHCRHFDEVTSKDWHPDARGEAMWTGIADNIRQAGEGKDYDCILGLSGGVDSSYLALVAKRSGLRPLAVHVDGGWNSELAVSNIEKIISYCKFDLETIVIDWEEMRDLQLAYLRSSISNQDVPQDHAFFANLYHRASKRGIKYVLTGGNIATEGIFPKSWHGPAVDAISLKAIHKLFGQRPLEKYRTVSMFDYYVRYPFVKRMRVVRPLNLMRYNKQLAVETLESEMGWRSYGRKHGESQFTKVFQNYYLPKKFGYDKRRPHLSSMIVSGQMRREDALGELEKPLYDPQELEVDLNFLAKKLRISRAELDGLIDLPSRSHLDYPNWNTRRDALFAFFDLAKRLSGGRLNKTKYRK